MFDLDLISSSKVLSLLIFMPIYLGALAYACWRPNQARFDAYARIPIQDDRDRP